MKIIYRIALAICAMALAINSSVIMVYILYPKLVSEFLYTMTVFMFKTKNLEILTFTFNLFLCSLSIAFLLSGFRSDREKKAISRHNELGEIRVSLASIENISLGITRRITGIKDVKASVQKANDNVNISIRVVMTPDVAMPEILQDIQNRVKKIVEEITGIKVLRVDAIVDNISTSYKSRVE